MEMDIEELNFYYSEMVKANLVELEVEIPQGKLTLKRHQPDNSASSPLAPFRRRRTDFLPEVHEQEPQNFKTVVSPINGVFYRSSSPTSTPFVKEGDSVSQGQTLCIVEAMKVMNEIKSEFSCTIAKILAENGKPVSKEQILLHVHPV
ncbi:MAG: hypothetical protein HYY63_07385 [Elusimicrobia bacterium]|nr:hypothetical protein [Elusimicrobiota bacterium]MBI4217684.1 hypothetical protein [Elusimicrobiota bacterium]